MTYSFHGQDPAISLCFTVQDGRGRLSVDDNFIILLASFLRWMEEVLVMPGAGTG